MTTLAINFRTPFLREWCLLHGLRSCSRAAFLNILSSPGRAMVLVPGGASEALVCKSGSYDLVRRHLLWRMGITVTVCEE